MKHFNYYITDGIYPIIIDLCAFIRNVCSSLAYREFNHIIMLPLLTDEASFCPIYILYRIYIMYHHSLFSYFFVFIYVSEKKARFQYLLSIIEESIAEVIKDFIKLKNYRTMSSADKFPKRSWKSFDKLSDKQKRLRQQAHYNSIIRAVECVATSSNEIEQSKMINVVLQHQAV